MALQYIYFSQFAPLSLDAIGRFNLNVRTQGFAIPDLVEFNLVEAVLDHPEHPLHEVVADAYQANLTLRVAYNNSAAAVLPGFVHPPAAVLHALAAYDVLDPDAAALSANLYAVHLSRLYGAAAPKPPVAFVSIQELHQDADLDGDGFSNLDEWLHVDDLMDGMIDTVIDWATPTSGQNCCWSLRATPFKGGSRQGIPRRCVSASAKGTKT